MELPANNSPLLVGVLVDVSGSMTSAIQNKSGTSMNRLQAFQAALGELANRVEKAAQLSGGEGDTIRLFAYGFGFGNPLSFLFGNSGTTVRDLLDVRSEQSGSIGLRHLARNWAKYKAYVESLAFQMFGNTPMLEAFEKARIRFAEEAERIHSSGKVLLVVSDGEPTDAPQNEIIEEASALKAEGVIIISCYICDCNLTVSRFLYGHIESNWPNGARLMFDCSSELPSGSTFDKYLNEHKWVVEENSKLFTQVNQSEILAEFIGLLGSSETSSDPHETQNSFIISRRDSPSSEFEKNAMTKKHVFLSYCHENEAEVRQLRTDLISAGEVVWWDEEILPGEDWKQAIRRAIKSSYAVVLCLSKEFASRVASGVYPEVAEAIKIYRQQSPGSIFLIPIRLSDCSVPDIEIDDTRTLDQIQREDLFPAVQRPKGLQRLVQSLRRTSGHP